MKKLKGIKALLAAFLVTAAMASPALVLTSLRTSGPQAALTILGESVRYRLSADGEGSVQMLFDIMVSDIQNCYGSGLILNFNDAYLTPSKYEDNSVAEKGKHLEIQDVFHFNEELLVGTDGNTIDPYADTTGLYSDGCWVMSDALGLDLGFHQEKIDTLTNQGKVDYSKSKIQVLTDASFNGRQNAYVVNPYQRTDTGVIASSDVVLGTVSFRVTEGKLPEILRYFNSTFICEHREDHSGTANKPYVTTYQTDGTTQSTFLVDVLDDEHPSIWDKGWQIYTISLPEDAPAYAEQYGPMEISGDPTKPRYGDVDDRYQFSFDPNTIVDVAVTDPDVTINAYQNYNLGTTADLITSMGRYSPTVTVTYADGHKENVPFPWGENGYTVKQLQSDGVTQSAITTYDPTASVHASTYDHATGNSTGGVSGSDYFFSQNYVYTDADGNTQTFPKPVTAHLKVTLIKVLSVTAEDLSRTYTLDSNLLVNVSEPGQLSLPDQARIITDVVPGNVSLVTPISGWMPTQGSWPTGAITDGTYMNSLQGTASDGTTVYWPDNDDQDPVSGFTPAKHCGTYTFQTSDATHTTPQGILRSDIQAQFPWLTVPDSEYTLQNATRKIVSASLKSYEAIWYSTETQQSGDGTWGDSNGDNQPTLTLYVRNADGSRPAKGSAFRIWLPNGQEIGTALTNQGGVTTDDWFTSNLYGHYTRNESATKTDTSGTTTTWTGLILNPGDPGVDSTSFASQRETLRRYINLGGWYSVSVCEDPSASDPLWSDQIPVYVPPRRNEYTESKVYNFLASNRGLANWPNAVDASSQVLKGDTLYLPRGTYEPLTDQSTTISDPLGLPLYEVEMNDGTTQVTYDTVTNVKTVLGRYSEDYGVATTYDGQTGAQPGHIYNVKVTEDPWTRSATTVGTLSPVVDKNYPASTGVYQYGPTPLYPGTDLDGDGALDGYWVPGQGAIFQPKSYPSTAYTATLRTEGDEKPLDHALYEQIELISADTFGITRWDGVTHSANNVALVTFDAKTQGYTVRQDFVLTIKNVGTADIYGLDINTTFDGFAGGGKDSCSAEPTGGHFVITDPPATFLPVGSTTTFTVTYVYDLKAEVQAASKQAVDYHDTLYITSSTLHNLKVGGQFDTGAAQLTGQRDDYLMEFDAHFTVSPLNLHKVTVIYNPPTGYMGTANLIVGSGGSMDPDAMNFTPTTRTYAEKNLVYVVVNRKDEYDMIAEPTCTLDDGTGTITMTKLTDTAKWGDDVIVYTFEMPNGDVTFTVDFYEPLLSKLRLEDLIDFSAPNVDTDGDGVGDDLKKTLSDTVQSDYTYRVWPKTYTADETQAAENWANDPAVKAGDSDYYLMTKGSADTVAGQGYDTSKNQYLVVIDAEDDWSQVEAKIRRVVYHQDYQGVDAADPYGKNQEIELNIQMDYYDYSVNDTIAANTVWNAEGLLKDTILSQETAFTGQNNEGPGSNAAPEDYWVTTPTSTVTPKSDSSSHLSKVFVSPEKGESTYVRITLSARETPTSSLTYRYFFLEIHRRDDQPKALFYYGNSPYGMIMNETWSDSGKTAAKAQFKNGLTFAGLDVGYVPAAARDGSTVTLTAIYWREAWVRNGGLYEPESFTGTRPRPTTSSGDTPIQFPNTDPLPDLYSIKRGYLEQMAYQVDYSAGEYGNLDLDDFAYFAILEEEFEEPGVFEAYDSAGRYVYKDGVPVNPDGTALTAGDTSRLISVTAEVTLLDTTQSTQVARFQDSSDPARTVTLDFGTTGRKLGVCTTATQLDSNHWPVKNNGDGTFTKVEDIRPGRYVLDYSYLDYDGTTVLHVYRPLVILAKVGDVNVDGKRDGTGKSVSSGGDNKASDEYAIENRVTDPLGYEAGSYDGEEKGYPAANLFRYRVCDVNNDRNVNNIDANTVNKAVSKEKSGLSKENCWLRFYKPVGYYTTKKATPVWPVGSAS